MIGADGTIDRDRIASLTGVVLLHAAIGWAFLSGLGINLPTRIDEQLKLFDVAEERPVPPPNPPAPRPARNKEPEGAAAPPNLRSKAAPIVVPTPEIRLIVPPPVIAAPVAGTESDRTMGASDVPGPGTGAGGEGTGTGSGRWGSGTGGGGGGGDGSPLRWVSGRVTGEDYPRAALRIGATGTVYLQFVVGVDGRVERCAVTRSSGNADLDDTTCRLIKQRFRYRPARDARGRPVPEVVTGSHEWWLRQEPDRWVDPEPIEDDEPR